jgi:hypothetical protein
MSVEALAQVFTPAPIEATPQRVGYGSSFSEALEFQNALNRAQANGVGGPPGDETFGGTFLRVADSLSSIDQSARTLAQRAEAAREKGDALTPGETLDLTVRCYEFLFQSQLASNIANRTSDGLQQMFRQQS